jgi:hypothetical protein
MIRKQDRITNSEQLSEAHDQDRHDECREGSLNLLSNPRISRWTRIQTQQMLSTLLQLAGAELCLLGVEDMFKQMDMTKFQNQLLQDDNNKMLADLRRWRQKSGFHGSLKGLRWDHGDMSGEEGPENSATDVQLQDMLDEKAEEMKPSASGRLAIHLPVNQPSKPGTSTEGSDCGDGGDDHSAGSPGDAPATPTGRDLRLRSESLGGGDGASRKLSRDNLHTDTSSARREQQAWVEDKRAELEARQKQLERQVQFEKDALEQLLQLDSDALRQRIKAFPLQALGQPDLQTRLELELLEQISAIHSASVEDRNACTAALETIEEQIRACVAKRDGVTSDYEYRKAARGAEIRRLQQKWEDMFGMK